MFYRRATDGTQVTVPLENLYAGPTTTPCWIIGGGPSLTRSIADQITASAAPRFTMNLAGSGLLRPHFWTSYDPTVRFHRSIYLDPGVTKFVHTSRAMDLVPETTHKVCDAPALYLIDRNQQRGFHDFPGQGSSPITDWQDSLIQAIDIAYRLGFRELYLAGCEMWIGPSTELRKRAAAAGVGYQPGELLGDFIHRCEQAGISRKEIESTATGPQYHFAEQKSLAAAIQTDAHYFRVAQTLRLCRRSMALAGLQLASVTPRSRLNAVFPKLSFSRACRRIASLTGNPADERTQGRYTEKNDRHPLHPGPMRDVRPHFWPTEKAKKQSLPRSVPAAKPMACPSVTTQQRVQAALERLPDIPIDLNEAG